MEDILTEIKRLNEIVDRKANEFDEEWFGERTQAPSMDKFEEYTWKRNNRCQPELGQLNKLQLKLRMEMEPSFSELPDYGDVMSLANFIECVKDGEFIDYDGFGYYVRDGKESNIIIHPSDVKNGNIRKDFDTIIWYNR